MELKAELSWSSLCQVERISAEGTMFNALKTGYLRQAGCVAADLFRRGQIYGIEVFREFCADTRGFSKLVEVMR
jgi:hypothetical protein